MLRRSSILVSGLLAFGLLLQTPPLVREAEAHDCKRTNCDEIKRKIRAIEARMRQPYSARQGVRMDARLKKLRSQRNKDCR